MPFDQSTRNRLARFVGEARSLLSAEFTRQLQQEYGLDPVNGAVTPLERLSALDDARRETARILRETFTYYQSTSQAKPAMLIERILREQAFTVLNRLCALRMAEARGLIRPAVAQGYQSTGFQLYARLAGSALGETGAAYRAYLFGLFAELAVELPPLFDRFSPQGRLFPRESALLELLELLNDPELEALWAEDETTGWIYQYFNSKEERQAMRAESSAPRNSRELAVRNQFFTPRYVVEFLTDNTLGRIWYEMTRGETGLKDSCRYLVRRPNEIFMAAGEAAPLQPEANPGLSQEELLQQPVYIPHRPLKDPREILMLDPACGSLHFGLYAFDLYELIYREAWEIEAERSAEALLRSPGQRSLHETYPDQESFLREVPRLIVEHNIHGIDIDPRAVQIAGLSLWLRAQKSWQAQGLKPGRRPTIRKANIVCAEPMPGDQAMLEEFLAELDTVRLGDLLHQALPDAVNLRATLAMSEALKKLVLTVWQEMELAGEAGSLLKIEETLQEAVAAARKASAEKAPLFRMLEFGLEQLGQAGGSAEADFWDLAEALTLAALQNYAERAENGVNFRRRLFAGDAAKGFAFIELCRLRYDVVVMNPPFGQFPIDIEREMRNIWRSHANDIYVPFILWASARLQPLGRIGAITSRNFLIGRDQRAFRPLILGKGHASLAMFVDLGLRVLDGAEVDTAAYILQPTNMVNTGGCYYWDFRKQDRDCLQCLPQLLHDHDVVFRWHCEFASTPANLIAYSASSDELDMFSSGLHLDPDYGRVTKGLSSSDDFRFLHLMWETPITELGQRWVYCAKGADYLWVISNINTVIDWFKDGELIASYTSEISDNVAQARRSSTYYYRPAATYTYRCDDFSLRALPKGCIFTNGSPVISPNDPASLPDLFALFLSQQFERLLSHVSKKGLYETGRVGLLPAPTQRYGIEESEQWKALVTYVMSREVRLENSVYFLGLDVDEKIACEQMQLVKLISAFAALTGNEVSSKFVERSVKGFVNRYTSSPNWGIEKISYAFGTAFGRWDIRNTTGKKNIPELPDPFAPLPACPPGMLQNAQGLPAAPADVPADYPLRISWPGILVDNPGHPEDVAGRTREALQVIWGERADAIEQEACQILGVGGLGEYFRKPGLFFAEHLKRYSKSRRQAPIYWPLATPSGSYTLWLYYHRLSDQILFTCVNDFVDPKLKQVGEEAARLRRKPNRSAAEEKELERLGDFEGELKDFRAELLRVAAFWKPNLNDGVEITAAPLWRLFQYKPWQKRLKETWEKLEKGEYDWAHLAYGVWPERVREKCKRDKSLAIAHGVEEVYVEPVKAGGKKGSKKKKGPVEMEGFWDEQ